LVGVCLCIVSLFVTPSAMSQEIALRDHLSAYQASAPRFLNSALGPEFDPLAVAVSEFIGDGRQLGRYTSYCQFTTYQAGPLSLTDFNFVVHVWDSVASLQNNHFPGVSGNGVFAGLIQSPSSAELINQGTAGPLVGWYNTLLSFDLSSLNIPTTLGQSHFIAVTPVLTGNWSSSSDGGVYEFASAGTADTIGNEAGWVSLFGIPPGYFTVESQYPGYTGLANRITTIPGPGGLACLPVAVACVSRRHRRELQRSR